MRRLHLIGIGTGDPAFVTMQAIARMNEVDVFFGFDKGEEKAELLAVRKALCARTITRPGFRFVDLDSPPRDASAGYRDGVEAWHAARAARVRAAILEHLPDGGCGGFLVWGDPALYDSTLRVVERAINPGELDIALEIVPGISSIQILAARHRIGLNDIGEALHITTGRRMRAEGMPAGKASVVVMLDGGLACRELTGQNLDIYWGAALGSPDEVLIAGQLDDVIDEIVIARAALRAKAGWVMDTYLLRRR